MFYIAIRNDIFLLVYSDVLYCNSYINILPVDFVPLQTVNHAIFRIICL
jgi:hypothetical protein